MIQEFKPIVNGISKLVDEWEPKLVGFSKEVRTERRNSQGRNIKQILGHMVDSASNNTHRIVHLQYQKSPLKFPNYATGGNNDRWIAIQNYENESWHNLFQLWKFSHLHIIHVVKNVNPEKLENKWDSKSDYGEISLKAMIIDFLRHMKLHLSEIEELVKAKSK